MLTFTFQDIPCDHLEDLRWTYSALGLLAMAVHWFLMVDLAVFSTGLSAFVLVCAQARRHSGTAVDVNVLDEMLMKR